VLREFRDEDELKEFEKKWQEVKPQTTLKIPFKFVSNSGEKIPRQPNQPSQSSCEVKESNDCAWESDSQEVEKKDTN